MIPVEVRKIIIEDRSKNYSKKISRVLNVSESAIYYYKRAEKGNNKTCKAQTGYYNK